MARNDEAASSDSPSRAKFEELLTQHGRLAHKVASIYARETEDRHDLAQEILTQTWRAWPSYDPARSFPTWMYRIALNVAISHRRGRISRGRHVSQGDLTAVPDTKTPHPDERAGELYDVIERLDDLNRALVLLYLEGHSYKETAEILGISETNVATKLNRIRAWLRKEFATPSGSKR